MKAFEELKIGCIGTGTMGGALISAMTKIVKPDKRFSQGFKRQRALTKPYG